MKLLSIAIAMQFLCLTRVAGRSFQLPLVSATDDEIRAAVKGGSPEYFLAAGDRNLKDLIPVLKSKASEASHSLKERTLAEMALARMGEEEYFKNFLVAATHGSQSERAHAFEALAYIRNKKAVPVVARYLDPKEGKEAKADLVAESLPHAAARALSGILPEEALKLSKRKPYGSTEKGWREWWKKNQQAYKD